MKALTPAIVLSMLFGLSSAAQAEDLQFLLKNLTSRPVIGMQVSKVSSGNWEENLLQGHYLPAGNQVDVVIADGARVCEYDILLTFDDRTTIDDRNINLCSLGTYTAHE